MDETPSGCFFCAPWHVAGGGKRTQPAGPRNHRRCCGLRFAGGVAALNHRLMDETPSGCFFVPHDMLRVVENEPGGFVLALGGG